MFYILIWSGLQRPHQEEVMNGRERREVFSIQQPGFKDFAMFVDLARASISRQCFLILQK